ncbi:hypothetical protein [Rhodanobacter glycinis]|uniref:hypothetical protein n=1 Tax=Rhodanobacter glycinis TaxID=582702 RepID=UPI0011271177|nr:hypothetical protein [Rhodanobacter glycinis]
MNPRFRAVGKLAFFASIFCLSISSAHASLVHAEPAATFLHPELKVGERLSDVFSKTVSTRGEGFMEKVDRISGTADYKVTGVTAKAIVFDEDDRYDGRPARGPLHDVEILRDGITNCFAGKCRINDQTSGLVFNPLLWGNAPEQLRAGMSWDVAISAPWEIGPAGTEQVRVLRVDPRNGVVTLSRTGNGAGLSSDDQSREKSGKPMQITTTAGRTIEVSLIPGKASWIGYTTIRKGVIVSDVIMVLRHVTLVSRSGDRFEGEQRAYTLLNLTQDAI